VESVVLVGKIIDFKVDEDTKWKTRILLKIPVHTTADPVDMGRTTKVVPVHYAGM